MTDINEEAEAEGETDILAGRNANAGHIALLRAIRAMSRAATALNVAKLESALPDERIALTQLESAFSHTRILLRALSTRERLDLSRRLTGVLTDAVRDQHPSPQPEVDPRSARLRRALSVVASLAAPSTFDDSAATRASLVAEQVLRIDPTARRLQDVAQQLSDAAGEMRRRRAAEAHALLDRAATGIATLLRNGFVEAPRDERLMDAARLAGALRDAQRGGARK